jgi:hypothetical protein
MVIDSEKPATARVFISCGQFTPEEKELGSACSDHFYGRGFKPYLAEEVQSFEALTENIFRHLRNSEYAVFIDCAREPLDRDDFRGSMFVNQELAIAAFVPIEESRVFHEKGVRLEGVAKYLIAKPVVFADKQEFLQKLFQETKKWRHDWRNELTLRFLRCAPNFVDQDGNLTDWYHLQVMNKHLNKYARNCIAYVLEIENLDTRKQIEVGNFELIWAGTGAFERHILPKRPAEIDSFFIVHGESVIRFNHRTSTSSQYGIKPLPIGNYLLTYLVVSDNFDQVKKSFKLEFGGDYTQIKFSEWDG